METIDEKRPDMVEQFGVAVNSTNLGSNEKSWAADRIAEVGEGCVALRLSADIVATRVAARLGAEAADLARLVGKLEAELAPLIWRVKAGDERGFVPHVVALFAEWMILREKLQGADEQLVLRFSARVVHEMLSTRCQACGGCGQQERVGNAWVRPRGLKMLSPKFRPCKVCGGGGLAKPLHHERIRALEITSERYEADVWIRRFRVAQVWLDRISRRLTRPLAIIRRRG